jgi:hypothetical protein
MAGEGWGLKVRALKIAYGAIFMGIAAYGASAWCPRIPKSVKLRISLLRGQRSALLSITKAYRTTSTDALPVLAGILPLDLHIQVSGASVLLLKGEEADVGDFHLVPPPRRAGEGLALLKRKIRLMSLDAAIKTWQRKWDESTKGRHTYSFFPDIQWRMEITKYLTPDHYTSQFVTGHGGFAGRLFELGLVSHPTCPCGWEVQDANHILWECLSMCSEREEMLRSVQPAVGPIGPSDLVATKANYLAFKKFAASYYGREDLFT